MKIRTYLVALILSLFIPFTILAGVMAYMLAERERAATVEGLRSTARALAIAVDGKIADIVNSLEILATAERLRTGDVQRFHAIVQRAAQARPDWRLVLLVDRNGQELFNTARPYGTPLPSIVDRDYFRAVLKTGAPVVAREAFQWRTSGHQGVTVAVPVFVAGEFRYVLVAALKLPVMSDIFAAQQLPDDWTGAVLDAGGTIIGRSRATETFVGQPATARLAAAVRVSLAGIVDDVTKEGWPALAAFARSERTGWTVVLGAPAATIDAAARKILLIFLAVGVGGSLLALALAAVLGRRISRSVLALVEPAIAIGRGDPIASAARSPVSEIQDVMDKLVQVSGLLRARECERQTAEERYQLAARATNEFIWEYDPATRRFDRSLSFQMTFGTPSEGGTTLAWSRDHLHPADRDHVLASFENVLASQDELWSMEYRLRRADGVYAYVHDRAYIVRDAQGRPQRVVGAMADLTERKAVEEKLRASEAQLAQAQKMEAIGQLTGGIAHDFNNLLNVVIGNLDLALERIREDADLAELIEAALDGALHGADLTQRLLAFARKQPLEPQEIDLNARLPAITTLLRRTLAESITITTIPGADLWPAMADPSRLDDAILNLAINARDAMPQGGMLTIETANVRLDETYAAQNADVAPGEYVMIAVTDTGAGMPPAVAERAFEPFYTTKSVGKGTGLGLSMVYGFVKQSGGHVKIYSEVGHGTTVRLYLPKARTEAAASADAIAAEGALPRGGEAVLVVEDNEGVRRTAVRILNELGYRVYEAANGPAALAVIAREPGLDLLFTDVVMPEGMSGYDLAQAARAQRPDLKVLFTSGYAEGSIRNGKNGTAEPWNGHLVSKPYRKRELALAVRRAIDQPA